MGDGAHAMGPRKLILIPFVQLQTLADMSQTRVKELAKLLRTLKLFAWCTKGRRRVKS